jgi:hypothetical protein
MKLFIKSLLILVLLNCSLSYAQLKNRVGIGLQLTSLDAPDDVVRVPTLNYQRQFLKRIFVNAQFTYINRNTIFLEQVPEFRTKFGLDFTPYFAILKYKENYLKIGIGASFWHRDEELRSSWSIQNGTITNYKTIEYNEWNIGYNAMSELDIALSKRMTLAANFGFINLNQAGISSVLGVKGFYKF